MTTPNQPASMSRGSSRILIALGVFAGWVAITTGGAALLTSGDNTLDELVTNGIFWGALTAAAFLFVMTVWLRWRDLGFEAPNGLQALRIVWFPFFLIFLFIGLATALGLPPSSTIFWVLLNTFFVGLSEEWMFRGVLFRALRDRLSLWATIWMSSVLFGSVHVLNVVVTGDLGAGVMQALAATMSGVLFCAILIRTGSLWPGIITHALWDFALFVQPSSAPEADAAPEVATSVKLILPLLFVLPNFLYALFLLRKSKLQPIIEAERE